MDIQATLMRLFGRKIERYNMLTNWYARDLRDFSHDELMKLHATCSFFSYESKELKSVSSLVKQRIGKENYRRDAEARAAAIRITPSKNNGGAGCKRRKSKKS